MSVKTHFIITLEGAADADSANVRALRHLLKYAGRRLGLRAIDIREEKPTPSITTTMEGK
jgi:hypothetical protein